MRDATGSTSAAATPLPPKQRLFMCRRPYLRIAMATAIAILLAAAGCGAPAGPLEVPEGTTETGGAWDVGTLMAFGTVTIRNPTDEAMTLLSATLNPQASHT